jgi:hypothetical protein
LQIDDWLTTALPEALCRICAATNGLNVELRPPIDTPARESYNPAMPGTNPTLKGTQLDAMFPEFLLLSGG